MAFCFIFVGVVVAFIYYNTLSIIMYRTFKGQMDYTKLSQLTLIIFIFDGIGASWEGCSWCLPPKG